MERNFDDWFNKFKTSISNFDYYVDFDKIYENVDNIKIELNILNSLIGSKNIEEDFKRIILKYPETLECIPILLAVRSNEIFIHDELNDYLFKFNEMVYSIDDYVYFMKKNGLFDLLENHLINNLYDYVLGVEVGLDSNGRKNRGGHLMEDLVEEYIVNAGYKKDVDFFKEMYLRDIVNMWNLDLSDVHSNIINKRFDFVIKTGNNIYVIETNFYNYKGSKLNEIARSYKMLFRELCKIQGISFIWITDGYGWSSAKKELEETFNVLDRLYSIDDLEKGALDNLK